LLQQLTRAKSPLARQQIALSAAQLMGRYDTLYALLTADEARRDRLIEKALALRLRENPELSDALRAYAYGDYGSALQISAPRLTEPSAPAATCARARLPRIVAVGGEPHLNLRLYEGRNCTWGNRLKSSGLKVQR
jgi:hypothetical protein